MWMGSWKERFRQLRFFGTNRLWVYPVGAGIGGIVGFFFYRNLVFCLLTAVLGLLFLPKEIGLLAKEKQNLARAKEFGLFVETTSMALAAGRSLENALLGKHAAGDGACRDYKHIGKALDKMKRNLRAGYKVTEAFLLFSSELELEEAGDLAEVLRVSYRAGGSLPEIFRASGQLIRERMELEEELRLSLLRQQLEQKLLFLMPFAVLALLMWLSPSYIAPLYGTLIGRLVMTGALAIMIISYLWSKKLSDIKI